MLEVISNLNNSMATIAKPKERQFQVVPVPAIFTRGRWECRDYKEAPNFVVTSNHNVVAGGENGAEPAMVGPVGDYIDKPILTTSPQSDIPSTIPLMRNDAKNVAAAQCAGAVAAILPEIISSPSAVENSGSDNPLISSFAPLPPQDDTNKESSSSMAGNVSSNQVAIDNKIEQAMDLVKTHLTFAVREEVEQLRTQISELESRVNNLEGENQILRQFAPPEIVANLPLLLQNSPPQQNGQQQQQQHKSSLPQQQHSTVALSGFENTMASIPSVSSAPVLTTMAGVTASTAIAGSSANNNTSVSSVTHTISTTQSTPSPAAITTGGVTLHIGDSATPSPPPPTPAAYSGGGEQPPGDPQHYQSQSLSSPTTAGPSRFVVTSTRPSTPASHDDEFREF